MSAHIVTVQILVDEPDEARVYDGLNEMFRTAQTQVDEDSDEGPWLVDWSFGHLEVVPDELGDSISNGTYVEGEAFS